MTDESRESDAAEVSAAGSAETSAEVAAVEIPPEDTAALEAIVGSLETEGSAPPAVLEHAAPEPLTTASVIETATSQPSASADPVSVWPFVAYVGAWAAFAGFVAWQLMAVPAGVAVLESPVYPLTVFGGLVLTFMGPLLIVAAWVAARGMTPVSGMAVFTSALTKGAVAMFAGVSLWWIALVVVDQMRLGRIL